MRKSLVLALAFGAVAVTGPYWATDEQGAQTGLKDAGYTDVAIDKTYAHFGWQNCNTSVYSTTFQATDPKGEKVKGYYCSGPFFKGTSVETVKTLRP